MSDYPAHTGPLFRKCNDSNFKQLTNKCKKVKIFDFKYLIYIYSDKDL